MSTTSMPSTLSAILRNGIGIPILVVMLLVMMILPLPPFMLDMMFTFNITISLIVILSTIYARRPLDFGVFPTILLVSTLLRLALNVASTRVVLLNGHTGTDAAGRVVEAFGSVVVGGNYTVGIVIFAILVIINFVVVTKGAGRISEVTARFTLDSMPGKQMAIDADLNAGIISQEEAKAMRQEIREESDFYGSMDGASKFVRGDAVAGILILFINLIGGLVIGMVQHDMSFSMAAHNYALLTIGDGLVAQVPSLLLSTAAAIMVTRVSGDNDMGEQVLSQLFSNPKSLVISASVLGVLGLIPGMPHVAFLSLAMVCAGMAFVVQKQQRQKLILAQAEAESEQAQTQAQAADKPKELGWDDVSTVDMIGLEVGYRLIPLVDKAQGGKLMERIRNVRKKISQELGFLVPSVHIRDNLDLGPSTYRVSLLGVSVGESDIVIDKFLAINPGQVFGDLDGAKTKDPTFGLDAVWITANQREHAQSLGYTVVDPSTVIATHISQLMQDHAPELLGHEEVQQLLDRLRESAPKLVEELVPDNVPLGTVVKVLQNLLAERIPIRDIRTIAEALTEYAPKSRDADALTAAARVALNRLIVQNINGLNAELPIITLAPDLEQILQNALQMGGEEGGAFEPGLVDRLQQSLREIAERQEVNGQPAVLLVPPNLRSLLARFAKHSVPNLHVLSYQEVPDNKQLKVVGSVGQ